MDLSELRDLLDYLENQGVDPQTLRQVFERYCPQTESVNSGARAPEGQGDHEDLGEEVLAQKTKLH
jgi:hypothetical protein